MDMHAKNPELLGFHHTGKRAEGAGASLLAIDGLDLRPALLAPYRELDALRHDFPLVLIDKGSQGEFAQPLSSLVDAVLKDVAPRGIEGERLRRHALELESELRKAVNAGAVGLLSELWDAAAARLGAREGETLEQVLTHAGGALPADGPVLGCLPGMPAQLVSHAWRTAQREKARLFRAEASRLVIRLSDILRAAYSHSQIGRQPLSLKAAVGGPHQDAFDFDILSRIVGKGVPRDELPPARHARLVQTLGVLESQRFYATSDEAGHGDETYAFCFDNCAAAAEAFAERLDDAVALVKALAIAELEVQGRYLASEHDLYFEAFDAHALGPDDLARLPDYLVCIPPACNDQPENAGLMEMLSSGLPVKVQVQTSDLLEEASIGTGHFAFGVRSARLATTAMGLGGMFVLQSSSSNLYALRSQLARGLACPGPALISVFAGDDDPEPGLPPYLTAAAALQSRAFPAFCYDAAAGLDWASRFSLEHNPQPEADWPIEPLAFVDDQLQRCSEPVAYTFADFVLGDRRHATHFALVPRAHWDATLLPAADWLALDGPDAARRVPYLLAVDRDGALQRVIVDARLMQAARRCLLLWRRLQEHGGIHDSHAERLLARERAARAAEPTAASATAPAPEAVAPAVAPAAAESQPSEHSRDEAWIDTARCPSCNECQLINDRMFAYDERKQAYIKDITAGSYAQLVEAAESCQVAIIHPGKPRDAHEPGLDALLARAEPFR